MQYSRSLCIYIYIYFFFKKKRLKNFKWKALNGKKKFQSLYCAIDGLFSSLPQYWVLPSHELSNSKYRNAHDNRNLWQWLIYPILSQCSIFYPRKTSENHTVFKSFQEFKNETLAQYGLRLISQWAIRSSETMLLANPDIVNEFYEQPTRLKSIPMQLYTIHSECHHPTLGTLEWKGNWILVRYMKVYI